LKQGEAGFLDIIRRQSQPGKTVYVILGNPYLNQIYRKMYTFLDMGARARLTQGCAKDMYSGAVQEKRQVIKQEPGNWYLATATYVGTSIQIAN
jgi:hypothetical protein